MRCFDFEERGGPDARGSRFHFRGELGAWVVVFEGVRCDAVKTHIVERGHCRPSQSSLEVYLDGTGQAPKRRRSWASALP